MMRRLCATLLRRVGWTLDPHLPDAPRYVLIGYPHTSNWDFVLAMLAKGALGLHFRWVAKHTLFRWPLGPIMLALGGIPVDRRRSNGFIEQLCERYAREAELVVVITPEGTRGRTERWRSGFYHLARSAGVPVALGYLDFARRRLGIGPLIELTGDEAADMARIQAFYADKAALYPDQAAPIRLRADAGPGDTPRPAP